MFYSNLFRLSVAALLVMACGCMQSCSEDESESDAVSPISVSVGAVSAFDAKLTIKSTADSYFGGRSCRYGVAIDSVKNINIEMALFREEVGELNVNKTYQFDIERLTPNKTYYVRPFVSCQGYNTVYGDVQTFKTKDFDFSSVISVRVSDVDYTSVKLIFTCNSFNAINHDGMSVGCGISQFGLPTIYSERRCGLWFRNNELIDEWELSSLAVEGDYKGRVFCKYNDDKGEEVVIYDKEFSFSTKKLPTESAVDLGVGIKWARFDMGATSYDDARTYTLSECYEKRPSGWRLPTNEELGKLPNKQSVHYKYEISEEDGFLYVGNNGKAIYVPTAGNKRYWTSSTRYFNGNYRYIYWGAYGGDTRSDDHLYCRLVKD